MKRLVTKSIDRIGRSRFLYVGLLLGLAGLVLCCTQGVPLHYPRLATTAWPPFGRSLETDEELQRKRIARTIESSQLIQIQIPWSPYHPDAVTAAATIATLARTHGRGLVVALDWMEQSRTELRRSDEAASWSFSDGSTRDKFSDSVSEIALALQPDYLVLGVEVNFYALFDRDGFREFVKLFRTLSRKIRSSSSDTTILVTFQYELLSGHYMFGGQGKPIPSQQELITHFGPELEMVGLSTYPSFVYRMPDQLPDGYFSSITNKSPRIGVFETSWPSNSATALSDQAKYAAWLLHPAVAGPFEIVTWASACDGVDQRSPPSEHDLPGWFGHLGLWTLDGESKPVTRVWLNALSRAEAETAR